MAFGCQAARFNQMIVTASSRISGMPELIPRFTHLNAICVCPLSRFERVTGQGVALEFNKPTEVTTEKLNNYALKVCWTLDLVARKQPWGET
jgi:hypothetical protein